MVRRQGGGPGPGPAAVAASPRTPASRRAASPRQTLAALRAIPAMALVPVVFVTARARPEETEAFRRLGAVGVITKPFDPVRLSDEVRALWERAAGAR